MKNILSTLLIALIFYACSSDIDREKAYKDYIANKKAELSDNIISSDSIPVANKKAELSDNIISSDSIPIAEELVETYLDDAKLIGKFDNYEVYQRTIYDKRMIIGWIIEYRPAGLTITKNAYFKGFRTVYIKLQKRKQLKWVEKRK